MVNVVPFDGLTSNNFIQLRRHVDGRLDEWSKRVAKDVHQLNWIHHHVLHLAAMSHICNMSTPVCGSRRTATHPRGSVGRDQERTKSMHDPPRLGSVLWAPVSAMTLLVWSCETGSVSVRLVEVWHSGNSFVHKEKLTPCQAYQYWEKWLCTGINPHVSSHPDQLSLLSSTAWEMSIGQNAVTFCSWEENAVTAHSSYGLSIVACR